MNSRIAAFGEWYSGVIGKTRWRRKAFFDILGTVCLTIFGPFGTYLELPLLERALYWTFGLAGVGIFMHAFIWPMLHAQPLAGWPRLLVVASGAALAAMPGTMLIYVLEAAFRGVALSTVGPFAIWAMVALLGFVIASIQFFEEVFLMPPTGAAAVASATRDEPAPALPSALRGDLISITMQDHYLEVTTGAGPKLHAMRFSDALAALQGVPGTQIHRSHWVSAGAIAAVERDGGKPFAVLTDGRRLPISRPYLAAARALLAQRGTDDGLQPAAD